MKSVMSLLVALLLLPLVSAANLTITSTAPTQATVGTQYTYQVTTSLDGVANLTYSLSTAPSGMTINTTSGFISFLPAAIGSNNITISVSNGTQQVTQSYTLESTQNSALSFSAPLLGGPKQRRSNPAAFDDSRKNVYVEEKMTIKNTGTTPLTTIAFSSNAASKFNVTFSGVPSTLDPGVEATVTVKARVPEDLDAFFPDKTSPRLLLGELTGTARSNNVSLTTKQPLEMQAANMLVIRDVTVIVRGRTKSVDESDRVENLKIRDIVQLDVDLENLYSSSENEDLDMNDVVVNIDTNTKTFDIDNKLDINDVRADSIETGSLTFHVEDDAQGGTYKITLEVTGQDDNGAIHGEQMSFVLEVSRKPNEISIQKVTLSPEKPACTTKQATLTVLLHNTGNSHEEKASVHVQSKELDFAEKKMPFRLARDDTQEEKFVLQLKPGKATIQIEAFYDTDKVSATDALVLDIPDCAAKLKDVVEQTRQELEEKTEPAVETSESDLVPLAPVEVVKQETALWVYPVLGLSMLAAMGTVILLFWILLKE
ncbi:hypothetical protein HY639_05760 [Candidatus Woesearchaeota archaeon]|nr:hypothetical protein [Candidatus Woesearchaeota archaeon]